MKSRFAPSLLTALLLALCGCQSFENAKDKMFKKDAIVVEMAGDGVELKVVPSLNQHCINGVRHLKNADWALAKQELEAVVKESPKDHQAHFALGIALEKLGDDKAALEQYKAANFYGHDVQYDGCRIRLEEKLGRDPVKK